MGKEIITFGVAGELKVEDGFAPKPKSRVTFRAEATYSSLKESFSKGDVTHALAIDPETFQIISIEDAPEQMELEDGDGKDDE